MQIAFLDTATLHRDDIDFSSFDQFGTVTHFENTSPSETAERLQNTDIVITNKVPIHASDLENAKNLKLVCAAATGVNHLDLSALKAKKIDACNVSGYSTDAVAQHTFAFILSLATSLHRYAPEAQKWADATFFTRLNYPIFELSGKTLGIIGLGTIGKKVATIAQALSMKVIALARENSSTSGDIPRLPAEKFFADADVITLHAPLTPETKNSINARTLALCKKSALLINTARGPLIDESALAAALKNGTIAGAGLDVLVQEPPSTNNPLLDLTIPNLLITPHTAWAAIESRQRLIDELIKNIQGYLEGNLPNRVA